MECDITQQEQQQNDAPPESQSLEKQLPKTKQEIEDLKKEIEILTFEKDDQVLVDKGFQIQDLLDTRPAKLVIPPNLSRTKSMQFSPEEVTKTQKISRLGIHVERAMRRVEEYQIFEKVLPPSIAGHSFVRRLSSDLRSNFDARAAKHFNRLGDAVIHLHGVGGRTVKKLRLYDLGVVSALKPDVIILEIGTNDLGANRPEVVGSGIDDLVQLLLQSYSVRVIGICEVIPRVRAPFFNTAATTSTSISPMFYSLVPTFFPGAIRA
ncbi:hypothetical protein AWC38_SpisGene20400 [Stylophora pistillata]|uniref:Uncharacterized protein n=1 Tax=Stylophora pistillata TaxID=50429 RepID=A0A2B4REY6_STYPI|nr:hypothetical protein AWC38_SpisGene20400 [Stylophora pistillata]